MKKKGLALLTSSICALSLAACGSGDVNSTSSNSGDTWSLFLYLCGSDLESESGMASDDIKELMALSSTENVNIYIQTGGSPTWYMDEIASDKIGRYTVENGNLIQLAELDNASMGSPETLQSFMDWGKDNYSSDKDMLILWDHGSGIDGLCYDDNYVDADGNSDVITLAELKSVMDTRDYDYEIIGMDACLMSNIETLTILKDDANYIVASEETEPGAGWYYTAFVADMESNPGKNGAEIGKTICDTYYTDCSNQGVESMTTLATIDASKIDNISDSLSDYMSSVDDLVYNTSEYGNFVRAVGKSENYGGTSMAEEGFYNLFDIVNITENVTNISSDKSDALADAVSDAVVYSVNGTGRPNANGISVYYPYRIDENTEGVMNTYGDIGDNSYGSLFDNLYGEYTQNELESGTLLNVVSEPELNDEGYYQMQFSTDTVHLLSNIWLNIYIPMEDAYVWLGYDEYVSVYEDTGIAVESFDGGIPMLNGEYITYFVYDSGEDYILYNVPIKLNGKETTLKLMWSVDMYYNAEYTILGTRNDEINEKEITPLKNGDVIVPIYYYMNNDGEMESFDGNEIVCTGNDTVEDVDISTLQDYYVSFFYQDIYSNTDSSDLLYVSFNS